MPTAKCNQCRYHVGDTCSAGSFAFDARAAELGAYINCAQYYPRQLATKKSEPKQPLIQWMNHDPEDDIIFSSPEAYTAAMVELNNQISRALIELVGRFTHVSTKDDAESVKNDFIELARAAHEGQEQLDTKYTAARDYMREDVPTVHLNIRSGIHER